MLIYILCCILFVLTCGPVVAVRRSLLPEERVLDLMAVWQHIELEDIAAGRKNTHSGVEEFRFFYKVRQLITASNTHYDLWLIGTA